MASSPPSLHCPTARIVSPPRKAGCTQALMLPGCSPGLFSSFMPQRLPFSCHLVVRDHMALFPGRTASDRVPGIDVPLGHNPYSQGWCHLAALVCNRSQGCREQWTHGLVTAKNNLWGGKRKGGGQQRANAGGFFQIFFPKISTTF